MITLIISIFVAILFFVIGFSFGTASVNKDPDVFGCRHDWQYLREWGFLYQQKRCKKCGKLEIEEQ